MGEETAPEEQPNVTEEPQVAEASMDESMQEVMATVEDVDDIIVSKKVKKSKKEKKDKKEKRKSKKEKKDKKRRRHEDSDDEDDDEVPAAKRSKKGGSAKNLMPNKPKGVRSAYIIFSSELRPQLKVTEPELKNTEVISRLAEMWRDLPADERATYEDAAKDDRARHDEEMELYKETSEYQAAMEAQREEKAALKAAKGSPNSVAAVGKGSPKKGAKKAAAATPRSQVREQAHRESEDRRQYVHKVRPNRVLELNPKLRNYDLSQIGPTTRVRVEKHLAKLDKMRRSSCNSLSESLLRRLEQSFLEKLDHLAAKHALEASAAADDDAQADDGVDDDVEVVGTNYSWKAAERFRERVSKRFHDAGRTVHNHHYNKHKVGDGAPAASQETNGSQSVPVSSQPTPKPARASKGAASLTPATLDDAILARVDGLPDSVPAFVLAEADVDEHEA